MKVALVVPQGLDGRGGIERMMTYLVRELAARGDDVVPVVVPTRLVQWPVAKHLSTVPALLWFLLQCLTRRFDIVHLNVAPDGSTWRKMLFGEIARLCSLPVVLHLHGSAYDDFFARRPAWQQRLILRFFNKADLVLALGPVWKRFVVADLGVPEDRVVVAPNGVPEPARRAEPTHAVPLIVTAGELGLRKGTDVLVAALAALPPDLDWRAEIAGNGEVELYRRRAEEAGLRDRIVFRGWLGEGEVTEMMARADIFVLPSREENQPVAILEALARGLPVVSTTVGAIPEQVDHGATGLLVPPADAAALSEAFATLIADPELRAKMGRAAIAAVAARFSVGRCAEIIADAYRDVLARRESRVSARSRTGAG